jgi:hypothetical protein
MLRMLLVVGRLGGRRLLVDWTLDDRIQAMRMLGCESKAEHFRLQHFMIIYSKLYHCGTTFPLLMSSSKLPL